MAQINIKDKNYLIKIIKVGIFQSWTLLLFLILSILILKDRFALLFLVILTIANFKGILLLFKRNLSGKDLLKVLAPNRSIQLPEKDLEIAIELVRFHLVTGREDYFLVVMPEVAIFHQERPFLFSMFRRNRFFCLETNEYGIKLSTYSAEMPPLFRALKPGLVVE